MEKNVPKLRFPGFTDAWEQRKLSEQTTMHARIGWQNLRTSEFLDDGDYMLITGTDFEDGRINFSTCHYVEKERYDQDKHIQIKDGNILITKDGTLGKVAYVQGLKKPATLNAGVFNVEIKDENESDGKYLFQYLKAPFLMDYVGQKATGGTIKHLNQNILVDFPVVMPEKAEQEKIGRYFEGIDNLITLHQHKCDEIIKLKKCLLQKTFPKEGEQTPEFRFPGFDDEWKLFILGEVTKSIKNGYTYKSDGSRDHKYRITRIESISSGSINVEKLGSADEINENYLLQDGDILFSHINSLPYIANTALYTAEMGDIYHGMNLLNIRSNDLVINSHFLIHILKKEKSREWFRIAAKPAVNQASISTSDVAKFEFMMPNIIEQKKLASLFDGFDNLITLHQRKLDEMKELKKSLLQQMFI